MLKYTNRIWINIAIFNLCIVATLGVIMRSKMVFDIPWINYNRLVDTHGNFAFSGWVTLALLTLMLSELPLQRSGDPMYKWLLAGITLCSWANLIVSPSEKLHVASQYISTAYILITYVFAWKFIRDIIKAHADRTVMWLAIWALVCLVISSAGTFMLAYLFSVKSLNAILYRDAMFGYLHMQYNGFFTLAVFSIAFNKLDKIINDKARKTVFRFSVLLCLTIIPSLFITFQWHSTNIISRTMSQIGSLLILITFAWLLLTAKSLINEFRSMAMPVRVVIVFSMSAFAIKLFLQGFTIFPAVNVLVFGNRPVIMGFLHLVFLGFVTLFIIAYLAQTGVFNVNKPFTRFALYAITIAIFINEMLLMLQGLGTMFSISIILFNKLLWGAGILLSLGTSSVALARKLSTYP
jgi:hypothetical protein